jgi:hypothetical protein
MGASHQTGWTSLVIRLFENLGKVSLKPTPSEQPKPANNIEPQQGNRHDLPGDLSGSMPLP